MAGNLFDLTDRVAVVSGAARGMGRAMSIGFAEYGADLLLADIDAAGMEDTAATIEALGRKAVPVVCDISDPDQIDALYGDAGPGVRPHRHPGQRGRGGRGTATPSSSPPTQIHDSPCRTS